MERSRELIAMLESVGQWGRGLRPLSTPVVGCGRAKFQVLLLAEITRTKNPG